VMEEAANAGDGVPIDLDGVTTLGWIGDAEKVRRLAEAEVVCVPSVHGESFGIVLVEALAAGVPVVASDLPGYRSVLRDGLAGRLTPPGEPVALAHALEAVLADDVLRRRLTAEGLAVAEAYSWDRVADRVEEVYTHAASLDLPRGRHGQPGRPWAGRALVQYWLWKARTGRDADGAARDRDPDARGGAEQAGDADDGESHAADDPATDTARGPASGPGSEPASSRLH
jgi:hypothetical protein